uniref:Mediator of RNA polymerase II transcription subunit 22 n=2 Tax=Lactuca sativa TaxID=4236 RepID=A0A9R1WFH8_LACSA|nr:hypothetical protein LSAT_V11C200071370 [Lactuca sativa]
MILLSPKLEKSGGTELSSRFPTPKRRRHRRTTLKLRTLNGGDRPLLRVLAPSGNTSVPLQYLKTLGSGSEWQDFRRLNFTMNKGGAGGGTSGAGGPTAAAAAAAAQKQKSLQQRVDNDIGSIVDNFSIVVNVARVNDPPVRNSQEAFMMEVRASRMVQAADSLLKLVSELKQTAIFSGFASLNDHVEQRTEELNHQAEKTDKILARIGEDAAASLKEMESHYYSSLVRSTKSNQHFHDQ